MARGGSEAALDGTGLNKVKPGQPARALAFYIAPGKPRRGDQATLLKALVTPLLMGSLVSFATF
jgi:hypothetical protein